MRVRIHEEGNGIKLRTGDRDETGAYTHRRKRKSGCSAGNRDHQFQIIGV